MVVSFVVLTDGTASAHRDGCHRWHSCPSDSGSYVCGDLGYTSECPKEAPDVEVPEFDPVPEVDDDPPVAPDLAEPVSGKGGKVSIAVSAERGSSIVVKGEDGSVVARGTGTGRPSKITFTAPTGEHTYTAEATDSSGNTSEASSPASITVDADKPELGPVTVTAARPEKLFSRIAFATEVGAKWTVTVAGSSQRAQGVAEGQVQADLWLPNGTYAVQVAARDAVGNVSTAKQRLVVSVPAPAVEIRRTTVDKVVPAVFEVAGSPRSQGTVVVPGADPARFKIGPDGRAAVSMKLEDGRYARATAQLTDWQGRKASAATGPFVIDTTPPRLSYKVDPESAKKGVLALKVATERNAHVELSGTLGGSRLRLNLRPDAAGVAKVNRSSEAGEYKLTLFAVDAAGNSTTTPVPVSIEAPLTLGGILALLVLMALVLLGIVLLWSRRARWAAWREKRRQAAAQRAQRRVEEATREAYRRALSDYEAARHSYVAEENAWVQRRRQLSSLLETAKYENGSPSNHAVDKLRSGERVLLTTTVAMLEERRKQGSKYLAETGSGRVVVTDRRVVFEGQKKREWAFDKLEYTHSAGPNALLMKVANRQALSGIRFVSDVERNRLLLEIAVADFSGRRHEVIRRVEGELAAHDRTRPQEPIRPEPPLTPGLEEPRNDRYSEAQALR
ncbi:Ig-like domain-containing protein [Actinopolymorpha cephalotaxi]|nr:hypothetical protein [Actinopolymorpha cephalotaxi]NYH86809.1 hypothetical protein [Actinopolymorpha cephalotaxi]